MGCHGCVVGYGLASLASTHCIPVIGSPLSPPQCDNPECLRSLPSVSWLRTLPPLYLFWHAYNNVLWLCLYVFIFFAVRGQSQSPWHSQPCRGRWPLVSMCSYARKDPSLLFPDEWERSISNRECCHFAGEIFWWFNVTIHGALIYNKWIQGIFCRYMREVVQYFLLEFFFLFCFLKSLVF